MDLSRHKKICALRAELHSLDSQLARAQASEGGNWRVIKRAVLLADKRDAMVKRIKKRGLAGEAVFYRPLDIETVQGFYDTVDSLNAFELKEILKAMCLSHERLRLDTTDS